MSIGSLHRRGEGLGGRGEEMPATHSKQKTARLDFSCVCVGVFLWLGVIVCFVLLRFVLFCCFVFVSFQGHRKHVAYVVFLIFWGGGSFFVFFHSVLFCFVVSSV